MLERIPVLVRALDPISEFGVSGALRPRPEIRLVSDSEAGPGVVTVLVVEMIDDEAVALLRSARAAGCRSIVLVARELNENSVWVAVEHGVGALIRRNEATPERLVQSVVSVGGGAGIMPPDLLGRLLRQVAQAQRQKAAGGTHSSKLTQREADVLRLIADGMDTHEIARKMAYSERTIKNAIHDVTVRFNLRNRAHAVAFAVRSGLI